MARIMISPSRYIQGEGELNSLRNYAGEFGKKALLVASRSGRERFKTELEAPERIYSLEMIVGDFMGECTKSEIERLRRMAVDNDCAVIIGLGGGKAIDTAKAVSFYTSKPVIIVPTIASTDAPTSKLSIIYNADGTFEEYFHLNKNPDLVLVDTGVIARAPVRFLVAGMGDALATYFEARSCLQSNADNMSGGKSTKAAYAIATVCFETLMADSLEAKAACAADMVTPALENIVEANILLSGLGFESSGLAAAHSIHDGLTVLEETHHCYHGEKVAFGTLVHLVLEDAPSEELNRIIDYCRAVGLPTCLKDLNIQDVTAAKVEAVAHAACAADESIHNMPFKITSSDVYKAIFEADKLGGA
jgi:glycerol dehydrogenase